MPIRKISPIYPSEEQVAEADIKQLLTWFRFLPDPDEDYKAEVMQQITRRAAQLRVDDMLAYTKASEEVGW